jgi:PAS domain S-box-containing protein
MDDTPASIPATEAQGILDAIVNASSDGIVTITSDGVIESFNPAAEQLFGYRADEIIGNNVQALMPEPYRSEHDQYMLRYLRTGDKHVIGTTREIVCLRKDGDTFPAELDIGEIRVGAKHLFTGIIKDISEQKKATNRYLRKTSELQTIFEALPDCFFRLTPDGTIVDYQTGELSRFHAATDKFLGNRLQDIFQTPISQQYQTAITQLDQTKKPVTFEYTIQAEDKPATFQARLMPFLRSEIIVVVRDISGARQAEESLLHYHTLAEILPVGIFRVLADGKFLYVNERWSEIADITPEAATGSNWLSAIHPDDQSRVYDQWYQAIREQAPFKTEFRFRHNDGNIAWVYCRAVTEHNALGEVTGYIGTITDITDRIKADDALRRAHIELEQRVEERTADLRATNRWLQQMVNERKKAEKALIKERNFISAILETAGALVVVCDRNGEIVEFNRSCQDTTGYSSDEVKGKHIWDLFLAETEIGPTQTAFNELVSGKSQRNELETQWHTRSGQVRLIAWSNTTILNDDGEVAYVICTGIDLTEQRLAEEEARQHQADLVHVSRLCTMGEMAAGLAHELNQPLAAIVSYTQGCVRRIANGVEPGELLNAMKQVTNQAQRAGEIIKRLRAFVSKGEPQRNIVQVNAMVREVLSMAKIDMRKHEATVRLRLTEQLPEVNVDMIQVEQVLLNLVRNGMEAMANTDPEQRELVIRTFVNDEQKVELCVSDAGEGLPDSNQPDKVFDAFFTTKKEGMGMGLAISRSIIEAHGGRLWATSNPDRGTTFHFTLPVQHGGDDHGD